jgi:hypothetical protein
MAQSAKAAHRRTTELLMSNGEEHQDRGDVLVATPDCEHRTVRSTYHGLRLVGLSAIEAGNLTAHLNGLQVAERGWSLSEIERILFLRALVDLGRISS